MKKTYIGQRSPAKVRQSLDMQSRLSLINPLPSYYHPLLSLSPKKGLVDKHSAEVRRVIRLLELRVKKKEGQFQKTYSVSKKLVASMGEASMYAESLRNSMNTIAAELSAGLEKELVAHRAHCQNLIKRLQKFGRD